MEVAVAQRAYCHQCGGNADSTDRFCRYCGAMLDSCSNVVAPVPSTPPPASPNWQESPWFVLSVLIFAAGPFGLPLLWRSRCFSRPWKIAVSVLVTAIMVVAVAILWYVLKTWVAPLNELFRPQ
jgi:hypothetical protein